MTEHEERPHDEAGHTGLTGPRAGPSEPAPARTEHDLAGVTVDVPAGGQPARRWWLELVAGLLVLAVVGAWWWYTSPGRLVDEAVVDEPISAALDPSLVPGTRIDVPRLPSETRVHEQAGQLAVGLAALLGGSASPEAGTIAEAPDPSPRYDLQLALIVCGGAVELGDITSLVAADVVGDDRSGSLALATADASSSRAFLDALIDQAHDCTPSRTGNRDDHVAVVEVQDTRYLEVVRHIEAADGGHTWVFLVQSVGDVVVAGHARGPADETATEPPELLASLHGLAASHLDVFDNGAS